MKRYISIIIFMTSVLEVMLAQGIPGGLGSRFSQVQFHPECGGWYFLSEQKDGETLYGLADKNGNVIASEGRKYKLHKGYIELYLLDQQKKSEHDQWILDMKQYEIDMNNYQRVDAKYKADLSAYNAKVEAAKAEATNRYNAERARVEKVAQAQVEQEQRQRAAQTQNSGWLGALAAGLGAVSDGLAVSNAVNAVQFEPFFDQVKGERGLVVPPGKPYNPVPTKPKEPDSGYYWASYSLRQPVSYSSVEFDKISDGDGYANVKSVDGKWGLVDASMQEVIPCVNNIKVLVEWLDEDRCMVKTNDGYGILNRKNTWKIPARYSMLKKLSDKGYIARSDGKTGVIDLSGKEKLPFVYEQIDNKEGLLYCKKDGLWGVCTQSFEELYPCQFQNIRLMKLNGNPYLLTQLKGQWGAVNFNTGKYVLPNQYAGIDAVSMGKNSDCFKVSKNNVIGLNRENGSVILPAKFDDIKIQDGFYVVKSKDYTGLYNSSGIEIIPADRYTGFKAETIRIGDNSIPVFRVVGNGKQGICNVFGKELIAPEYNELVWDEKLMAFIAADSKGIYGVLSLAGDVVLPFSMSSKPRYSRYNPNYFTYDIDYGGGAVSFTGENFISFKKYNRKNSEKISKKFAKLEEKNGNAMTKVASEKHELINVAVRKVLEATQRELNRRNTFSFYARNYVERIINDWQQRGEFEKIDDWKIRVNEKTRSQKIYELTGEAQNAYIAMIRPQLPVDAPSIIGSYDPDNETYLIKTKYSASDILVHVPSVDAQEFKANFANLKREPSFFIENDGIALSEYHFTMPDGTRYSYSNQASLTYNLANVEYNFNPVEISDASANRNFKGGKQTINTRNLTFGTSDIDVGIPKSLDTSDNTFAVIIANENYQQEESVDYAYNDGSTFKQYCTKALGIPESNVHFRPDATLNDMRFEFNWIRQMADAYEGKAKFIVYYAGHGMPDAKTKDAYLLPVDGYSSDVTSGYRLSDVYESLGKLPSENVLAFVDACFSGSQRDGHSMSKGDRGVAITPDIKKPNGNLVVFSATSGNETAHAYDEKQHGLFTYYLLKKIKEHEGALKFGDLADYVKKEVNIIALRDKNLSQTPTVTPGANISLEWKKIQIK